MIIFTGLTASSFTLTATPGNASDMDTQRAVINGLQIVGVIPEPDTLVMILIAGTAALLGIPRNKQR